MNIEIIIKRDECTGCCYCADHLPSIFKMDSENIAYVHNNSVDDISAIENIINNCPAECIIKVIK